MKPSLYTTIERARNDGIGPAQILNVADWHNEESKRAQGRDRRRHKMIAADLEDLAVAMALA